MVISIPAISAMLCVADVRWITILKCMWDLFRSIPSIETEGVSVLDEYYWLNKADPNYSLVSGNCRIGGRMHIPIRSSDLSDKGAMEIMKLFFTPDEELYNKRID